MGKWRACFDEATDAHRQDVFVVAGIVAERKQWKSLHRAWRVGLAAGRPLRFYSSKDGGMRDRPGTVFHGWTDTEVRDKRRILSQVLNCSGARIIANIVLMSEFRRVMDQGERLPRAWDDPYLPCFATSLQGVAQYMEEQERLYSRQPEPPVIMFDRLSSPKMKGRVCMILDEYRTAQPGEPVYRVSRWCHENPIFVDSEADEPGIQMADFIANTLRDSCSRLLRGQEPSAALAGLKNEFRGTFPDLFELAVWKRAVSDMLKKRMP